MNHTLSDAVTHNKPRQGGHTNRNKNKNTWPQYNAYALKMSCNGSNVGLLIKKEISLVHIVCKLPRPLTDVQVKTAFSDSKVRPSASTPIWHHPTLVCNSGPLSVKIFKQEPLSVQPVLVMNTPDNTPLSPLLLLPFYDQSISTLSETSFNPTFCVKRARRQLLCRTFNWLPCCVYALSHQLAHPAPQILSSVILTPTAVLWRSLLNIDRISRVRTIKIARNENFPIFVFCRSAAARVADINCCYW